MCLYFCVFRCSFMIMFQTLTTSNWHEIMNLVRYYFTLLQLNVLLRVLQECCVYTWIVKLWLRSTQVAREHGLTARVNRKKV